MSRNAKNGTSHNKVKLVTGDLVRIIAGKEASGNHEGRVLEIDREKRKLMVQGLNIVKKTKKRVKEDEPGEIIEIEAYMDISNVMLVCSACGPTRVGYSGIGRAKVRICRKCEKTLS